jgi:CDP-diacylglycerol--glycerol-3-phosphate 3-phosphatidyltransferase
MKIEWNLPNKLTIFRIILVPLFAAAYLYFSVPAALAIFIIASVTDFLDGHIARKYNLITDFGKFFDPLADKILVLAALAVFTGNGIISTWFIIIIISREFFVSGLRQVAAASGSHKVIPAGIWGKLKTAFTMIATVAILVLEIIGSSGIVPTANLGTYYDTFYAVSNILMIICTALTVISAAPYAKEVIGSKS